MKFMSSYLQKPSFEKSRTHRFT